MEWLGLHYIIWIIMAVYFLGMLLLGWWSKHSIHDREGFLLGNRRFGVGMMVMHAFGAGTHPGDVAGVVSKTVDRGASGIWVSWMWMFGTPFYWIIAPVVRRMRCLTVADYFEQRFGPAASVLYILVAVVSGVIVCASVMLATTRTVQGMMGKASVVQTVAAPAASAASSPAAEASPADRGLEAEWRARGVATQREADTWFLGILVVTTAVFLVYSYWGGIVAAIRTDMIQGLMIIALSFVAIPVALELVGGWSAAKGILAQAATADRQDLALFDPKYFSLLAVLVLCVNAPFSMMAQPHLVSVTSAGRTEWEGRVGFTYGNIIKRICTMGWCVLALCWLAFLIRKGASVHADAAFGDSVRFLLHPALQGIMLACVLAAAMSTGDALQVTCAGLVSENLYRRHIRKDASEAHYLWVTRITGVVIILAALGAAVAMRKSVVESILNYFKLTATVGVSVVVGILWRRMNTAGVFASTLAATAVLVLTKYILPAYGFAFGQAGTTGLPLLAGLVFGILGSYLGPPPKRETIEKFFKKIYVPIGEESKLDLPFDEAVPPEKRWLTSAGLFLVKPSRQSWVGFLVTVAICLSLVAVMTWLLA